MTLDFIAIVSFDLDGRITKYQDYETETEADDHVVRVLSQFPDAFVAPRPDSGWFDWQVVGGVLVITPQTEPVPLPTLSLDRLADLLISEGLLTRAKVDGTKL